MYSFGPSSVPITPDDPLAIISSQSSLSTEEGRKQARLDLILSSASTEPRINPLDQYGPKDIPIEKYNGTIIKKRNVQLILENKRSGGYTKIR